MDMLIDRLSDPRFLAMMFAAIAAMATVLTIALPLVSSDPMEKRMKLLAVERSAMRERERARLGRGGDKVALRQSPRQAILDVVNRFNLGKWVGEEAARDLLVQAGYRGPSPYMTFLVARMLTPIVMVFFGIFYLFVLNAINQPPLVKVGIVIGLAYLGMHTPKLYLKNKISKRQLSIKRAFPDALDLLLICVESGMSIEAAFRRVSDEIGRASLPLAEELMLTTAELSYLQDRRMAYENLQKRVQLDGVKAVCVALQQAERYGTPLGTSLRVMAQENRDMRMMEAEKKAAGLPPKLTVPMIIFFLPVLFVVIMGPAVMKVSKIM
ncbi:bacterial type II secretion system protein F domain protein [Variibacter gotjawalensis]|uniref:Bacterial type II secretion system protein F domain protein n=1 Tax=Variibacter gotjawalensis TaxID=1333996 RepID=A0A0S3PPW7_9BRAD|nr:type II secretion system F family protein [Variibacter gotjawalensis]NIK48103.1 tight adherence protein C [Variibacter gotjawalensis]RZS49979.1 tight adherence protein C [Variibacter gotjawalensis]BAT57806.1 bacterial type II secretion system protein F domain protein [Variibacter gotjawalensis]